jgi:ubiquinone/menaquinone biosynthesis C-methylase UbiE
VLGDREAYAYLPASTAYLPDPTSLRAQIGDAGFAAQRRRPLGGGSVQMIVAERDARASAGRAA